jgi:hypothetical protein
LAAACRRSHGKVRHHRVQIDHADDAIGFERRAGYGRQRDWHILLILLSFLRRDDNLCHRVGGIRSGCGRGRWRIGRGPGSGREDQSRDQRGAAGQSGAMAGAECLCRYHGNALLFPNYSFFADDESADYELNAMTVGYCQKDLQRRTGAPRKSRSVRHICHCSQG